MDRLYLVCVIALASLFVVDVVSSLVDGAPAAISVPVRGAGQTREVDLDSLRERIRQGRLSDREASHAHPVDPSAHDLEDPKAR